MPQPSTAPSSIVESVFHRLVSRRATVREVESLGDAFRLITLASSGLVDRRWRPGDMVQLGFTGFEGRAYTPLSFSPSTGAFALLGYVHGHGVASSWLASATVGEQVFFVGPRSAGLSLDALPRPLVLFGDETSFGTAAALLETSKGLRDVALYFEVSDEAASSVALKRLGLDDNLTLFTSAAEDRHLARVERELGSVLRAAPNTRCVFTGKASSIQRMYKASRRAGLPAKQVTNVAYWAPGRKGFSGVQR
jgi:NADPH-dependent ferric siderophore reductase